PSAVLSDSSIEAFAAKVREMRRPRIVVLSGAGISTAAGIPDFRTPGTGLYANLAKYRLPAPEAIFDLNYFRMRPDAFWTLARELDPSRYVPTYTHFFIRALHEQGWLLRNYTQNIDMLERKAGIPEDLLVEAHGTFATARCL
ncbi:SIR2-domain-containing protein, partial [Caulochytrium protostelioides]